MARKPDEPPSTAWDIEVARAISRTGGSREQCIDITILRWLMAGDPRPLAEFLIEGHMPGPEVRKYLGYMIGMDSLARKLSPRAEKHFPFKFAIKRRSGAKGAKIKPEAEIRDELLAENANRLRPILGYQRTISRLMEVIEETHAGISRSTVEKAVARKVRK